MRNEDLLAMMVAFGGQGMPTRNYGPTFVNTERPGHTNRQEVEEEKIRKAREKRERKRLKRIKK